MPGTTTALHEDAAEIRVRTVRRVLWAILVANWAVAALKLSLGLASHAASLTADGLHSFIDGTSNVIGLFALAFAARPADEDHPYGHGKFEALASLAIGVMVGATAVGIGRMAIDSLLNDAHPNVSVEMIAATVGTLLVNIVVTRVEGAYGKRLKSPILIADAQHTLSDVLVSLAVLASLIMVHFGLGRADGIVALAVMGFIGFVAWRILRDAIGHLVDSVRLDPDAVRSAGQAVQGVTRVTHVRSRGLETAIYVDLTIEVAPELSVEAAHSLAHAVEASVQKQFPEVADVVVHVEPQGASAE